MDLSNLPEPIRARLAQLPDRFWRRVEVRGACWIWTGATTRRNGYGLFRWNGRKYVAHRLVFEAVCGPTTLKVLHRCDNPRCVRPVHLFAGTQGQNLQDAMIKGRLRPSIRLGMRHHNVRHPFATVQLARRLRRQGIGSRRLARRFGISVATAWTWITQRRRARA
jgi:hypothetical protein